MPRVLRARGFDEVSVDEIADEAKIARRTFFGHFPSKEDVVLGPLRRNIAVLLNTLLARPGDEPFLESIRAAALAAAESFEAERDAMVVRAEIMSAAPRLFVRAQGEMAAFGDGLRKLVAERLDVDPDVDLRPWVIAATVIGTFQACYAAWYEGDRHDYPRLVARALDILDAGLSRTVESV